MTERTKTKTIRSLQTKYSPLSKSLASASLSSASSSNIGTRSATNLETNMGTKPSTLSKKPSIFSQIGDAMTTGVETIKSGLSTATKSVASGVSTVSSDVSSEVSSASKTVSDTISPVADTVTSDLESTVKSTVKAVQNSTLAQRFSILFLIPIQKHGFSVILTMSIILGVILVYREFNKDYLEQHTTKRQIGEIVYENFVGDSDESRIDYKADIASKEMNTDNKSVTRSTESKDDLITDNTTSRIQPVKTVTLIQNDPDNNTHDKSKDNESSKPADINLDENSEDQQTDDEKSAEKEKKLQDDIAEFDKLVRSGFCDHFVEQGGQKLEDACLKLTPESCDVVDCCARLPNNKCVAANKNGPLYKTDTNGKPLDVDYYYYKGKCVGKCEDQTNEFEKMDSTEEDDASTELTPGIN